MRAVATTLVPILAALALLAVPAPAAAPSPSVSVSPRVVMVGGRLLVTGRHWPAGSRVELLIGPPRSEADHVGWTTASAAGTLRRTLRIGARARTGRFVLLACRRECRVKAQASFRIAGALAGRARD